MSLSSTLHASTQTSPHYVSGTVTSLHFVLSFRKAKPLLDLGLSQCTARYWECHVWGNSIFLSFLPITELLGECCAFLVLSFSFQDNTLSSVLSDPFASHVNYLRSSKRRLRFPWVVFHVHSIQKVYQPCTRVIKLPMNMPTTLLKSLCLAS